MNNPHIGHRERMFSKLLENQQLYDHELLEILLYFCISQKDTNGLAHSLMQKFKTIDGVFNAKYTELIKVDGVGKKSALLIMNCGQIFKRMSKNFVEKNYYIINNTKDAIAYCDVLFLGKRYENFCLILLNTKGKVIDYKVINEGGIDKVQIDIRRVMELVIENYAHSVILAHNHPGGISYPSENDIEVTNCIINALSTVNVDVKDHLICGDDGYFSFYNNNLIKGKLHDESSNKSAAQTQYIIKKH